MSVISQLMVELGINTAAFSGGIDKATHQARAFAADLKSQFSGLSAGVQGLTNMFGSMNPVIAGVGNVASQAFGMITTAVGGAGGSMGALVGISLGVAGAAAGAAAGLGLLAKEGAEVVHSYEMMSMKTGIAIRDLQMLKAAGSTVDVSLESLQMGFRRFGGAVSEMGRGATAGSSLLRGLGVSAKDPMEALAQLADVFQKMPDGPQKSAMAVLLFGRAGMNLIPILNEGRAGLGKFRDMIDEYGGVIDHKAVEDTKKWEMENAKLAVSWEHLKLAAMPALSTMTEGLSIFLGAIAGAPEQLEKLRYAVAPIFGGDIETHLKPKGGMTPDQQKEKDEDAAKKKANAAKLAADAEEKHRFDRMKSGTEAGAKLEEAKAKMADFTAAGLWKQAEAIQAQLPGLEHAAKLAKERLDYLMSMPETKGKAVDASKMEVQKAYADLVKKGTEATIENSAAEDVATKSAEAVAKATEMHAEKTAQFKKYLSDLIPVWRQAAITSANFKAEGSVESMLDGNIKRIEKHIESLKHDTEASNDIQRAWNKNTEALIPMDLEIAKLTASLERQRAAGAVDPRVEEELKKQVRLRGQVNALLKQENDESAKSVTAKVEKEIGQQLTVMRDKLKEMESGNPFAELDKGIEETYRKATGSTAGYTDALREQFHQAQTNLNVQQAYDKLLKGLGIDTTSNGQRTKEWNAELAKLNASGLQTSNPIAYAMAVREINKEMADAKAKTGGFGDGIRAAFADFNASMKSAGGFMKDFIGEGINGISKNLSDMVVKGKADWKGLCDSMESMLMEFAIKMLMSQLLKKLFGAAAGGSGGGIFGMFGGGKAGGGDVMPGKAYLVGEKGPELFSPGMSGTITPNTDLNGLGKSSFNPTNNFHIHGVTDADSFRRSQSQIMARAQDSMMAAWQRNK